MTRVFSFIFSLLAGACLFAQFVSATSLRSTESEWQISQLSHSADKISFRLERDAESRQFDLTLDKEMFAESAQILQDSGNVQVKTGHTYMQIVRYEDKPGEWATAQIQSKAGEPLEISAIVYVNSEAHEISSDNTGDHRSRRLAESTFKDEVLQIPGKIKPVRDVPRTFSLTSNKAQAFFPGCYPLDVRSLDVKISVAVDAGYYNAVNKNNMLASDAVKMATVLAAIEKSFSSVRPIYLLQLNVNVRIDNIVVGTPKDSSAFLRRAPGSGCASAATQTLSDFQAWVLAKNVGTAHWHLLTNCHPAPGTVGVGFEGGLCDTRGFNSAISSYADDGSTWYTVAHEMGHVFGAAHTFYGGMGGLMDYGSGRLYGGEYGFHPDNADQICSELSSQVANSCPYLQLSTTQSDNCGNGVLEPNEDCECSTLSKTSCGLCKSCRLTKAQECSTPQDGYVVRSAGTPAFISVGDASLAGNAECCVGNKVNFTTCNGGRDVCSATGTCDKACATYNLPPCGFDATGCIQMCVFNKKCTGIELLTQSYPWEPVGKVPDGIPCRTLQGVAGKCATGVCSTSANPAPTSRPTDPEATLTRAPVASIPDEPTQTNAPTLAPSASPTGTPSSSPTVTCPAPGLFVRCPNQMTEQVCVKTGCTWCGKRGSCKPDALLCDSDAKKTDIFAHCLPLNMPELQQQLGKGEEWKCPNADQMAVCAIFGKSMCEKNPFIMCKWCSKINKCVPRRQMDASCSDVENCARTDL